MKNYTNLFFVRLLYGLSIATPAWPCFSKPWPSGCSEDKEKLIFMALQWSVIFKQKDHVFTFIVHKL